jgi:molecular chaperone IbpA
MWMRNVDLSPLMRSFIGFDRLQDLVESALEGGNGDSYPPYNIERTGADAYRIVMAVAGFTPDELSVSQTRNALVITGAKKGEEGREYLYRGLPAREFQRRFELADFVRVTGAHVANGLLSIDLVRELPEEMRPRRIEIIDGGKPVEREAMPRLTQAA